MKKTEIIKILIIALFFTMLFYPIQVNAAFSWSDLISQSDGFLRNGYQASEQNNNLGEFDEGLFQNNISSIFNAAFAVGVVLTVVIGGVLGIKFMVASAEDKAKIKEMLIPYVWGCVVIYGAFGIWKLTVYLGQELVK